jgi:5-oxopent-3-ene-1,2,5-tricarboxylate decarboxylase / 2-hydroxyhepta-2,4-diene-1,7-dioate isomerase
LRIARFVHAGETREGEYREGRLFDSAGHGFSTQDIVWLPPSNPSKIIGLVLNYRDHASELGLNTSEEPVIFLKPPSSLIGNFGEITYPEGTKYMHYEAELCAVIGKSTHRVRAADAMDYIRGFTIANDVTVRDFITNTFRPPVKAKGFDTFCPAGPYILTTDEVGDISNLKLETRVNGETKQVGTTSEMTHTVPEIVEYLSHFMTLLPGDMILTGTPKGISAIKPGDVVEIEIGGLGRLVNTVVAEKGKMDVIT